VPNSTQQCSWSCMEQSVLKLDLNSRHLQHNYMFWRKGSVRFSLQKMAEKEMNGACHSQTGKCS